MARIRIEISTRSVRRDITQYEKMERDLKSIDAPKGSFRTLMALVQDQRTNHVMVNMQNEVLNLKLGI